MESIVALPFQDEIVQVCAPPMRGTNAAVIGQGTQPTAVFTYWRGTIMSPHTSHSSNHVKHAASSSQVPNKSHRGNARAACDADIAKRAYEKFEARGCAHGLDREDWAAASHELIAETFGHSSLSPSRAISALPDSKQYRGA
jgi:hypothetical protein